MRSLSRREFLRHSARLAPALALGPSLLAACTSSKSTEKVNRSAQILVGFGTGNDPNQIPTQSSAADAFQKAHPGTEIRFLRIPDSDQAATKLGVLIAAGTPPDLVLPTGIFGISLFLDQNVWLDLAPFLDSSGVDVNDFQDQIVRGARAPNFFGEGSSALTGVPAGLYTHGVGYNKDLFVKAGIPEPPHDWNASGWTYDKLLEVATALTLDGKGRTPDQAGFDPGDIAQFGLGHWDTGIMTLGFGAHTYDPQSRKLLLDSPEYVQGLQFGVDLTNKHHVLATDELAANVAAGASDPQLGAWQAGKIAMVDMCTCDLPSFGTGTNFGWDVAAWPRGPKRLAATLNTDVGSIVAPSDNHDLSFEILRFLLTEPANERPLATRGYAAIPALKSQSGAFIDFVKRDFPGIDLQVFLDAIPFCTSETEEWYPAFQEVGNLGGEFLQSVYDGKAPAAEQLPEYQAAAQQKVDAWFKTHKLPSAV